MVIFPSGWKANTISNVKLLSRYLSLWNGLEQKKNRLSQVFPFFPEYYFPFFMFWEYGRIMMKLITIVYKLKTYIRLEHKFVIFNKDWLSKLLFHREFNFFNITKLIRNEEVTNQLPYPRNDVGVQRKLPQNSSSPVQVYIPVPVIYMIDVPFSNMLLIDVEDMYAKLWSCVLFLSAVSSLLHFNSDLFYSLGIGVIKRRYLIR